VLIATDVAARGLDIPAVALVVQYDAALSPDDFVHRIGRTGRIGNKGLAVAFINNRQKGTAHEILEKVEKSGNRAPAWLRGMAIASGQYQQIDGPSSNGNSYTGTNNCTASGSMTIKGPGGNCNTNSHLNRGGPYSASSQHSYGGQDFRLHQKPGLSGTAGGLQIQDRDAAKKFGLFDANAYGEGNANQANRAAQSVGPAGQSFERMPTSSKQKGFGSHKERGIGRSN